LKTDSVNQAPKLGPKSIERRTRERGGATDDEHHGAEDAQDHSNNITAAARVVCQNKLVDTFGRPSPPSSIITITTRAPKARQKGNGKDTPETRRDERTNEKRDVRPGKTVESLSACQAKSLESRLALKELRLGDGATRRLEVEPAFRATHFVFVYMFSSCGEKQGVAVEEDVKRKIVKCVREWEVLKGSETRRE